MRFDTIVQAKKLIDKILTGKVEHLPEAKELKKLIDYECKKANAYGE